MSCSLHVVIATIGRPTLQVMINSILPFLKKDDHLSILFDGVSPTEIDTKTEATATVHIHHEPTSLGYWGHGIRNKYAPLLEKTDFVMHADDDDEYDVNAFDVIRERCKDLNTLYVFKYHNVSNNTFVPSYPKIANTNIGTPCGIIPYELNKKGTWGHFYGGDFAFYESIEPYCNVVFCDEVVYKYIKYY